MAWKLSNIRTKVRRLTGRPSTNQVTDDIVNEYINNFYQNDLSALLNLREQEDFFTFATLNELAEYSGLPENFSVNGPVYIDGNVAELFLDEKCFNDRAGLEFQSGETVGTGDGGTTNFTGTLGNTPVDNRNFIASDGVETFNVRDLPVITGITADSPPVFTTSSNHNLATGDTVMIRNIVSGMTQMNNVISVITVSDTTNFSLDTVDATNFTIYEGGGEVLPLSSIKLVGSRGGSGTIVASTGVYSITFNAFPISGAVIKASYGFYSTGRPTYILYSANRFTLRAVPDRSYQVRIAVTKRAAALSADGDTLENDNWGKLVAYGAAIDLLNDFGQQETAQQLEVHYRQMLQNVQAIMIRDSLGQRSVPSF